MADSIGKRLKDERKKRGISPGDVYKRIKISQSVILAMEDDNFEILSPVYMKSFLKIYAKFLGLDSKEIMNSYCEHVGLEIQEEKPRIINEQPVIDKESIFNRLSLLLRRKKRFLVFLLCSLIVLFLFGRLISNIKRKSTIKAEALKESKLSGSAESQDAASVFNLGSSLRLSVRAKADCWMRVKVDGKLIFQGTLKKGEMENWQAKKKIEVKLGNPAGVDLELNGRLLEQFGKRTAKSRYVTITKEGIKLAR